MSAAISSHPRYCYDCGNQKPAQGKFITCSTCKIPTYCSAKCAEAHGVFHLKLCKVTPAFKSPQVIEFLNDMRKEISKKR